MRKLLITRGLPGSGKSHTLKALGLDDFTLGADTLRLQVASPILTSDGRMMPSPQYDAQVWAQIFSMLEHRMMRGETTVVDATHPTANEFRTYLMLADRYGYSVACLDFSEVPADVSTWMNEGRALYRNVPPRAVEIITARMALGVVPAQVERIMVRSDRSHLAAVARWLHVPVLDIRAAGYRRVMHVGDIQGCHTALMGLLTDGLRDDTLYIFVGDACDRGIENGKVMRWFMDEAVGRANVRILWGNHEDHLHRESLSLPVVSGEFGQNTLPQLVEAGITRSDLTRFCNHLEDMFLYVFDGQKVMVTHAGLSTVPQVPWMVSARQCSHGTGRYEDDVDTQFAAYSPPDWVQVHGHRNHHDAEVQASPRSYNLEASVEDGGHLRGLLHDASGFHPLEISNPVFRPFYARRHHRMTIVPAWIQRNETDGTLMSEELHASMLAHPEVRLRASEAFPHVSSLNFSKKVFFAKSWDSVTVKARGIFVNTEDRDIVSRFADKFWTVGEKPEVSMAALKEKLVFPITLWVKENGFLGLLGYDRATDKLFPSSKTTTEGPFAEWFTDILAETISGPGKREALKRFLRDTESAMAFEVIDPIRDPHMIEYPNRKLVLLDVVRRSTAFERLPYDELIKVGKNFGFEVKKKGFVFKDWRSFEGWRARASSTMDHKLEGYVIEDSVGYQVKDKLPFYAFWKLCRGMKDALIREREVAGAKRAAAMAPDFLETRGIGFTAPLAVQFLDWCRDQDTETLRVDIISLRNAFEQRAPQLGPSM